MEFSLKETLIDQGLGSVREPLRYPHPVHVDAPRPIGDQGSTKYRHLDPVMNVVQHQGGSRSTGDQFFRTRNVRPVLVSLHPKEDGILHPVGTPPPGPSSISHNLTCKGCPDSGSTLTSEIRQMSTLVFGQHIKTFSREEPRSFTMGTQVPTPTLKFPCKMSTDTRDLN